MTQQSLAPILVTGGTGRTGGRQARRLPDRRIPGIDGSRREGAPFYWHDSGTWPRALDGASAAYLCYSPDLALPGASLVIARFAKSAAEAGVQRLVLLSGRGEDGARAAERSVQGPRLLTLNDVAAELSAATGRRIEFLPCSGGEFGTDLANDGVPGTAGTGMWAAPAKAVLR